MPKLEGFLPAVRFRDLDFETFIWLDLLVCVVVFACTIQAHRLKTAGLNTALLNTAHAYIPS